MVIDNGRPGGETEGVKTRWGWWLSRRRRSEGARLVNFSLTTVAVL